MKKVLSAIICVAIVPCLCSCGNRNSKFDSEYKDDYATFGIMEGWEQTEDDYLVSWEKGEDFIIEYESSIIDTNGKTSEELKQDLLKYSEVTENTKLETKQIGDYDCFIAKNIKIFNGEYENFISFCSNGLLCKFHFSDSAENTVINMIKTFKISPLSNEENLTLDSDWESSYIKFNISSKWVLSYESNDENSQFSTFEWLSDKGGNRINFHFFENEYYERLTTYELEESWNDMQEWRKDDPDTYGEVDESLKITDSFVENGVAYIVISSDDPYHKEIEFENEGISGTIKYNTNCEDVVMELINTIVFY